MQALMSIRTPYVWSRAGVVAGGQLGFVPGGCMRSTLALSSDSSFSPRDRPPPTQPRRPSARAIALMATSGPGMSALRKWALLRFEQKGFRLMRGQWAKRLLEAVADEERLYFN